MTDAGYDVSGVLPVDGFDRVPPGTNLLVSGPAMSGKRRLVFELLAIGDDPVVVVTTDDPANRIRARFTDLGVAFDADRFRIVDASGAPGDDAEDVHHVSSPSDLTGMGVAFTKAVDDFAEPDRLRLGFLSISTLLQYVDDERTFSFLHVLTRRAAAGDYFGAYTIDPTTHEDRFVNVVTSIFDAVVELRETDDGREVRVRGLPDADSGWTALSE
ncbi:MAG: RAD55 family ATPase [Haloplanus sp.]